MLKINILIKRLFCLSMALILSLVFMACDKNQDLLKQHQERDDILLNSSNNNEFKGEASIYLADEDFIIKDDINFIELGGLYENIKTNETVIHSRDADEKSTNNFLSFENFSIKVVFSNQNDEISRIIGSISLTTQAFSTSRGIKIGDSISSVFEKYGEIDSDSLEFYMYHYKNKILIFYIDKNERVTGIKLELV